MRRGWLALIALTLTLGCTSAPPPVGGSPGRTVDAGGAPSSMGTGVAPAATTFRLWAPNATAVAVEGDFARAALARSDGGVWSGTVTGAPPGARYRYVLETPASGTLVRNDPRALQVTADRAFAVVHDPRAFSWTDQAFHPPPFQQQIIYELHLATFVEGAEPGSGTWASAATRLDHLQRLGITTIEVMPAAQFPGPYSWGYDPVFPFAPETRYGTPDDARRFVDAAHARGLAVIVDVVHNHWGPAALPTWCFDGPCFGAGNGGIYFYTDARRETGFGPRPDFGRLEVRDYVADNARMWLDDYHADGLRWDSTVNIRRAGGQDLADGWALLRRINDLVDATAPAKLMVAEDLQGDPALTRPTAEGGAGFDAQWDPAFSGAVRAALAAVDDGDRDLRAVAAALAHLGPRRVIYTENHDEVAPQNGPGHVRLPALISPATPDDRYARKRATLGAALLLTAPGIPLLFMGQEILESLPFPFRPAPAIDWTEEGARAGITALFRDLTRLRRGGAGATTGLAGEQVDVYHLDDAAKVIAYRRWGAPGDDVVVVANFSVKPYPRYLVGLPSPGVWHVRFNGDAAAYAPDFGDLPSSDVTAAPPARDGMPVTGAVALGAYAAVILAR
jgi:1,4-alpha-glucan branching enzyme